MDLARSWRAPAVAGRPYLLLGPHDGHPSYIRFVEVPNRDVPAPFTRFGWNAIEIIVGEVDDLARSLVNSPFKIVGPPKNLSFSDDIRAMQVMGPAGEILYLTEVKKPILGFDLPMMAKGVGYPFIVILGGNPLADVTGFYRKHLGVSDSPDADVRVSLLSQANGLDPSTLHRINAMPLRERCYIEADEFPPAASSGSVDADHLPAGIASVTFELPSLKLMPPSLLAEQVSLSEPPYCDCVSTTLVGAAGEIIELIERGDR